MKARLTMLLAAILAATALGAGCGGSSDESTVTASSLSKAAFVKKANAACERTRADLSAFTGTLSEAIGSTFVPGFEELVEEVRSLGAPSGDEAEVEAFLKAMEEDTQALDEKQASISTLPEFEEEFKSSAKQARKYGLTRCAFYVHFSSSP